MSDYREAYRTGALRPEGAIADVYRRIRQHDDPSLFISLRPEAEVVADAQQLDDATRDTLPLWGIPVAVKDNIDVAGLPTTAACPAFSYGPGADATAVARLRAAGALVIGKTNLDQFATGLVGTRSPYGIPRNPFCLDLIPGGSSSGSAAAVSAGIVPLALGTDTAGSGRVPAMYTNIVGLKPSLGLVSTAGVLPACRTLDCVSIFALTVADAATALDVVGGFDPTDPFSRAFAMERPAALAGSRVGVPARAQLVLDEDGAGPAVYAAALDRLRALGADLVEINFAPFGETAQLLYEGPWLAERYLVVEDLLSRDPDALHPITREVIEPGGRPSAADAFRAIYRLQALRARAAIVLEGVDVLCLPTAPGLYTLAEIAADNVRLNSRLGTYTNFVNLLDLCGLAIPAAITPAGRPYGVTLLAKAGRDRQLTALGEAFADSAALPLGATGARARPAAAPPVSSGNGAGEVALAVFGAHMSGLPLNRELLALGGRLVGPIETAPCYRFYELPGGPPVRPGLLRVAGDSGAAIRAELWALPEAGFGRLTAAIPSPLGIGKVTLADGRSVPGFLAEAAGIEGARDITRFGGWREYLQAGEVAAA